MTKVCRELPRGIKLEPFPFRLRRIGGPVLRFDAFSSREPIPLRSKTLQEDQVFMDFTHPLARGAKVWTATLGNGETRRILVIVTNATLDTGAKKYNPQTIERLTTAAEEFLAESGAADGYLFANRLRDWEGAKDR
jgi:hypothetical protein